MTLTIDNEEWEETETEVLETIKNSMEEGNYLSDEVVKVTFRDPANEIINASVDGLNIQEESNSEFNSSVVYGLIGVVPLVVGISAYFTMRKNRKYTTATTKKGYQYHPDDDSNYVKRGSDINTNSTNSCEEEEGNGLFPSQNRDLERKIGVLDGDIPTLPNSCKFSPATQETQKVTNTFNSSKKRKESYESTRKS